MTSSPFIPTFCHFNPPSSRVFIKILFSTNKLGESKVAQNPVFNDLRPMKDKLRADELLLHLGLCENRTRAQALILAGKVKHGTERVDKASRTFPRDTQLTVETPLPYVGRGGLKMENFLSFSKRKWRIAHSRLGCFHRRLFRLPSAKRSRPGNLCGCWAWSVAL